MEGMVEGKLCLCCWILDNLRDTVLNTGLIKFFFFTLLLLFPEVWITRKDEEKGKFVYCDTKSAFSLSICFNPWPIQFDLQDRMLDSFIQQKFIRQG